MKFDLHVLDRRLLRLGKAADIVMGVSNVVFQFLRDLRCGGVDFVAGQDDIAVIAIKLGRIPHRSLVAACFDVVQDGLNRVANVPCIICRMLLGFFEIGDGHGGLGSCLFGNTSRTDA